MVGINIILAKTYEPRREPAKNAPWSLFSSTIIAKHWNCSVSGMLLNNLNLSYLVIRISSFRLCLILEMLSQVIVLRVFEFCFQNFQFSKTLITKIRFFFFVTFAIRQYPLIFNKQENFH